MDGTLKSTTAALKKVLCFGDSLTEGWIMGGTSFHPYTTKLSQLLNQNACEGSRYEVINAGVSGETVCKDMVQRLPNVLKEHEQIDAIVLQGGSNDILDYGNNQDIDFISHFHQLLDIAQNHGIGRVLVMTIMEGFFVPEDGAVAGHEESDTLRRAYNKQIMELAGRGTNGSQIFLCDMDKLLPMFELSEEERKLMWDDFLHPSVEGYNRMGEIVYHSFTKM